MTGTHAPATRLAGTTTGSGISVVIPVRDGEAFIGATLRTVLNQTLPADEILVMDDGSSDGTVAVTRAVAPGAQVVAGPFGSASAARGHGASLARGNHIMFLDADDLLGPTVLEELRAALAGQPDGIAVCPWRRYRLRGRAWIAQPASCARRRRHQDDLAAWLCGWYHPPCAVLWSRSAYAASGGWDPAITVDDDGDVMMRALAAGRTLARAGGGTAYYRHDPAGGSLSARRLRADGLVSRLAVLVKITAAVEAAGIAGRYRRELVGACRRVADDAGDNAALRERALDLARRSGGGRGTSPLRGGKSHHASPVAPPAGCKSAVPAGRVSPDLSAPRGHTPLVSIVVPTYNRAAILKGALESVLAQSYGTFEVIVVDDGSTEDIAGTVARFADPRLRTVRQPQNSGVAAARNRGLSGARGEFVAFLDSDDRWRPDKLAAQVELLDRRPDVVGLVYCGVEAREADGTTRQSVPSARGDVWPAILERNVVHYATSGVIIRREVVDVVGGFDEDMPANEDHDYWARVARFFEFDHVPAPLVLYDNTGAADSRSANFQANMRARAMFAERYRSEALEAGVAHRYDYESARRQLAHPADDRWRAALLLARAIRAAPRNASLYTWLVFALLPGRVRRVVRRVRRAAP